MGFIAVDKNALLLTILLINESTAVIFNFIDALGWSLFLSHITNLPHNNSLSFILIAQFISDWKAKFNKITTPEIIMHKNQTRCNVFTSKSLFIWNELVQ